MDLSKLTTEELLALKSGDLSKLSTESLQALKGSMATAGASTPPPLAAAPTLDPAAQQRAPAEPQRMRMMAQGASLGWSDEAEAAFRSMFPGQEYDKVVDEIRGEIGAYKAAQPGSALTYELAGGAMTGAGLLKSLTGKSPTLARLLATSVPVGGVYGGVSAAGMADGAPLDRLAAMPAGAVIGAMAGPAAVLAGKGVEMTAGGLMDFARRFVGNRGAKIVEKELQRIAVESKLSPDEIIDKVRSGEIMAENATLRDTVRAYTRGGGTAGATLRSALTRRPEQLTNQAIDTLNKSLAPGMTGNVRQAVGMTDDQLKLLEGQMYQSAYGQGGVITQDLLQAMQDAILRTRGKAASALQEGYTAQTGKNPFFTIAEDGSVTFNRAPTVEDAEILRRGLRDLQGEAFQGGRGSAGGGYKEAEQALRQQIDTTAPAVGAARSQAAQRRAANDAFDQGKTIFGQNADQVAIDFEKIIGDPNSLKYFRAGVMDAIRAKMASGNRTTTMARLADQNTKEGQILRTIFPGDDLDAALGAIGRAAQSRQAAGQVLGGSGTAPTQMAAQRIGQSISPEEGINALSGNMFAVFNIARKVVNNLAPANLTPQQRDRVAQILVSEDPAMVARALQDNSAMAALQQKVARIMSVAPGAALGATSTAAGVAGSNMTQGQ